MRPLDKIMMDVKFCCCGCTLRTGTLILLWLSLISAILDIWKSWTWTSSTTIVQQDLFSIMKEEGNRFQKGSYSQRGNYIPEGSYIPERSGNYVQAVVYSLNLYVVMIGIISALGLYGVLKRRPSFLLPYIYLNVVQMVLLWIGFALYLIVTLFAQSKVHEAAQKSGAAEVLETALWYIIIGGIIILSIICAITQYFASVVYCYYKQLESEVAHFNSCQGGNFGAPLRYDAQLKAGEVDA